jgi:hypothetical protein
MVTNIVLAGMLVGLMGIATAQDGSTIKPTPATDTRTITGCLTMTDDEFVLTADGGGIWELVGNSVRLDGYTGNTVTITGIVSDPVLNGSQANARREAKVQSVLKHVAGYGHMTVTKLTWLSNTCGKNS